MNDTINDNMNDRANETAAADYIPQFAIYHANAGGTGCAIRLELHPATGEEDGYFMLQLANQLTVGDRRGPVKKFPTFNWERRITVKLGFNDICKMLQVLRGECESIDDGKGLYHRSARFSAKIVLRHVLEPIQAYSLEVYRNSNDKREEDVAAHIMLSAAESYGLATALENSIGFICFGVPRSIAHVRQPAKGIRDASAA